MKILLVSNTLPDDPRVKVHGIYKRLRLFLDAIKEIAEVECLFYVPPNMDIKSDLITEIESNFEEFWQTNITLTLCHRSKQRYRKLGQQNFFPGAFNFFKQEAYVGVSGQKQVQALEHRLAYKPDIIFAHRLQAMCPLLLTKEKLPPIFFDLDDIEHISLSRQFKQPALYQKKAIGNYFYLPQLKRGELRAIRTAYKTFVCSEHDRAYLTDKFGLSRVEVVPNSIQLPTDQSSTVEPTLLFIGSYTYQPNVSAAEFLLGQIWPHIQQSVPKAKLLIAGAFPEKIQGYQSCPLGVEFTGFVESLDELYQRARVVCCPILSGGGTRVKLIEAAAYRKAIVSTHIGAEGLDFLDGKSIILRDDPQSFADACINLLQNQEQCDLLGKAAYEVIAINYDRKRVIRQIQHHLQL